MIDFVCETLIDVSGVAKKLNEARGLEYVKVGGKVVTSLEAVQRLS